MMKIDEQKTAFNARTKASMRKFLRSKTWEEKLESIARLNKAGKIAREGMQKALAAERQQKES
jgi:hypothetical protein